MWYLILSKSPSLLSPAFAKIIASYCPSFNFLILVSTFPLKSLITKFGLNAFNCIALLILLVPTTAPSGKSANVSYLSDKNVSLTSSLCVIAVKLKCSSSYSTAKSFSEWTAICAFPFNNSSSTSFINNPFPPISANGLSRILSPCVTTIFRCISKLGSIFKSSAFICSLCHNANLLPLVAITIFFILILCFLFLQNLLNDN